MSLYICVNKRLANTLKHTFMKQTIALLAISLLSATVTFGQKKMVENAAKEAALVPAIGAKILPDRKACAITNKSDSRTITVRVEESVMINDFLQKRTRVFEKVGPKEQKFVGYAGCDASPLGEKCMGYKIMLAYYDDAPVQNSNATASASTVKAADAVAAR